MLLLLLLPLLLLQLPPISSAKALPLSDHLDYDPEEYFVADDELDEEAEEDAEPEEGCCCECETVDEDLDCSDCPFTGEDADEEKQ